MGRFLLVSGSLRAESANRAALRTLAALAPPGLDCHYYDGLATLSAFNPDEDREPLDPEVRELREAIHRANAVVFCTPEYAGALPGSLKNLLDWTIGDDQPGSIYEKPVGWINTSPRGAAAAHRELRAVLGYAHARIVDSACAEIPITAAMIGADGLVADDEGREALTRVMVGLALAAGLPH